MSKVQLSDDNFTLKIRTDPSDANLQAYAEWLDDQKDDRADYLRAVQNVRSADRNSIEYSKPYRHFHELRKNTDAAWIEEMNLWLLNALPLDFSGDPIKAADLDDFEYELEIAPLPLGFREFLLSANGGDIREYSRIPDVGEVGRFHSINCEDWGSDLVEQSDHLWDVLQNTDVDVHRPVPFATCGFQVACLNAAGPDRGKVYIYDEANEETRQFVAGSFTQFIVNLEQATHDRAGYEPGPLFEAIQLGDREAFQKIFKREVLEEKGGSRDETPLICALQYEQLDIIRFLLSEGANPNARRGTECAMDLAAQRNKKLVELLLKYGADPNGVDSSSPSPLFWALMNGRTAIAKLLVKSGARVETRDSDYPTVASACDDDDRFENELMKIHQSRS